MKWWAEMSGRLKLATVALAVALVAVSGALASQRLNTHDTGARTGDARRTPAPVETKPVSKALELGTEARISSNYKVTVADATLFEGQSEQYIVATVKAEYTGKEEGDPWADLIVEFSQPDKQTLDESSCPDAVRETNASDPPPMDTGDVESYAVCFDLPSDDIDGGRVTVEEAYAKGERASWSTDGASTKALPAPAPRPTAPQGAGTQPRTQPRPDTDDSDNNSGRYDSSDVEEYRDKLDDAIEKYEKQRDNIKAQLRAWKQAGYDGDGVDDYEDWLDDVEEAIDTYKKQRDSLPD